MNFSEQLNEFIDLLESNSKELSQETGLSSAVISRYRNGKRVPNVRSDQMKKLVYGIYRIGKRTKAHRRNVVMVGGRTRIQQPHAQQGGGRAAEKNVARHVRWAHPPTGDRPRKTAFANRSTVHATHILLRFGFRIGRSRHENGYTILARPRKDL